MKRYLLLLAVLSQLCLAPSAFGAIYGTVDVKLLSDVYGSPVTVYTNFAVNHSTVAGPYNFAFSNADADGSNINGGLFESQFQGNKRGFCVDLLNNISWGQQANYDVVDLSNVMSSQVEVDIRNLFAWFVSSGGSAVTPQTGYLSDALSVAIWERMTETNAILPLSVNTGNVTISWNNTQASNAANLWLGSTNSTSFTGSIYALLNKDDPRVQGQVVALALSLAPPPSVPEPGTLVILLGLGLSACGFRLVRRRRN